MTLLWCQLLKIRHACFIVLSKVSLWFLLGVELKDHYIVVTLSLKCYWREKQNQHNVIPLSRKCCGWSDDQVISSLMKWINRKSGHNHENVKAKRRNCSLCCNFVVKMLHVKTSKTTPKSKKQDEHKISAKS